MLSYFKILADVSFRIGALKKIKFQLFSKIFFSPNLMFHKPSQVQHKIWARLDLSFWRLLDTNRQTNKHTPTLLEDKNIFSPRTKKNGRLKVFDLKGVLEVSEVTIQVINLKIKKENYCLKRMWAAKNYNVKLVISEVYAFLVLQCTVSGR